MFKKLIFTVVLFIAFTCQSHAQSLDNLKAINYTVWLKFYKAFKTLDYTLMEQIHSKDLVRISGGKNISDFESYINNYKARFNSDKENNISYNISLRFFERINNDSVASERGIYKLMINPNSADPQIYYGQFHVILKKENGEWKIVMDYDSTENNTIDSKAYNKAYGISETDKFTEN
ncbi:nuclear transport factor 2 family protein [Olleya sp. YS]|uniref:nuclear transport factor 2 family protein n=1 Tax=Olleya sp. YS TaxID=3028318 RepID=UPI00243421C1|nr:nuclear transport factor 2 family protein [Olleya sp. YS]WGD34312.1 nuclear transport factor 2 family protein [Olleya sp. YS]